MTSIDEGGSATHGMPDAGYELPKGLEIGFLDLLVVNLGSERVERDVLLRLAYKTCCYNQARADDPGSEETLKRENELLEMLACLQFKMGARYYHSLFHRLQQHCFDEPLRYQVMETGIGAMVIPPLELIKALYQPRNQS